MSSVLPRQIVAVDWSGRAQGVGRSLWLAIMRDGAEPTLEHGRSRQGVIARLIELVREESSTIVGLDFCFSFPTWFFQHLGVTNAPAMWAQVAAHGEEWIATCPWPFWGRAQRRSPTTDAELYRRTERYPAKSVFQLYYPGAVGTSSLRGMPYLLTLRDHGLSIWPFDQIAFPAVVEIYPRRFTGAVTKRSEPARTAYLASRFGPTAARSEAAMSEDAFDAYVSAQEMHARIHAGAAFAPTSDPELLREGIIWDGVSSDA